MLTPNNYYEVCSTNNRAVCCTYVLWYKLFVNWYQGGVSPQSSVLPPATTVTHKVKDQEAKVVKVKGQT